MYKKIYTTDNQNDMKVQKLFKHFGFKFCRSKDLIRIKFRLSSLSNGNLDKKNNSF